MVGIITKNKNILLLGSGGVGKSNFLRCLRGEKFEHRYLPTIKNENVPITIDDIEYNFIDIAGQEIKQNYNRLISSSDAVMIMFDVNCRLSYRKAEEMFAKVRSLNESIPVILIGNKSEYENRTKPNLPYYQISVKRGLDEFKQLIPHLV